MKKHLLILFVAMFAAAWSLNAQTIVINEGFENGIQDSVWTQEYVVGETPWAVEGVEDNLAFPANVWQGSKRAYLRNTTGVTQGFKTRLVSKVMDLSPSVIYQPELTFWYANPKWTADRDTLRVLYKTGHNANWKQLAEYSSASATWQKVTLVLPEVNSTYQIAFEGTDNLGRGIVLDSVKLRSAPECTIPYDINTTNMGNGKVNIAWSASWDADAYELIVTKDSIDPDMVNDIPDSLGIIVLHEQVDGMRQNYDVQLTSGAYYYVYLRSLCFAENSAWNSEDPNQNGAYYFRVQETKYLPYVYGFNMEYEAGILRRNLEWTWGTNTGSFCPYISTNLNATESVKYSNDGTTCLIFASGNTVTKAIPAGQYAYVATPALGDTTVADFKLGTCQVSFWATVHKYTGRKYAHSIIVGVMTDPEDVTTFVPVDTVSVWGTSTFQECIVDLAPYQGEGKYVAFASNFDKQNTFYIDNVRIEQKSPINKVIKITVNPRDTYADIAWEGNANSYNVLVTNEKVDPANVKAENIVAQVSVNGKSYRCEGLEPDHSWNRPYYVYVQAQGAAWSNPYAFVTIAGVQEMPYTFDMEQVSGVYTIGEDASVLYPKNMGIFSNDPDYPHIYTSNYYKGSSTLYLTKDPGNDSWITLPMVDKLSNKQITFYLSANTTPSQGNATVGVMTNPMDINTFIPVSNFKLASNGYTGCYANFLNYEGPEGVIAIVWEDVEGLAKNTINYIDELTIDTLTACMPPVNLTIDAEVDTAIISWDKSPATEWELIFSKNPVSETQRQQSLDDIALIDGVIFADTITWLDTAKDPEVGFGNLGWKTTYYVYLRTLCGEEKTIWVENSFKTPCPDAFPFPYREDFESFATSLKEVGCWQLADYNGTGYPMTYKPSSGAQSGVTLELWSTSTTHRSVAIMPPVEGDLSDMMLSFDSRSYGATTASVLYVGSMGDIADSTTFVAFDTIYMDGGNTLVRSNYDLSQVNLAYNNIAFTSGLGGTLEKNSDMLIDNVMLRSNSCIEAFNVKLVDLEANSFGIEWSGKTDGDQWLVTILNETDSVVFVTDSALVGKSLRMTGLTPQTRYLVRITPGCDTTVYTDYIVETLCLSLNPNVPNKESFESVPSGTSYKEEYQMPCWTAKNASPTATATYKPHVYKSTTYAATGTNAYRLYSSTTYHPAYLASPKVDCDHLSEVAVTFNVYASTSYWHVFGVMSDPNDISTFVALDSVKGTGKSVQYVIDMSEYADSIPNEAKFVAWKTRAGKADNFYVDDISITKITCPLTKPSYSELKSESVRISSGLRTNNEWILLVTTQDISDSLATIGYVVPDSIITFCDTLTARSKVVTGLQGEKTYYVSTTTVCDGTVNLQWASLSFLTPCKPITPEAMGTITFSEEEGYVSGSSATRYLPCWTIGSKTPGLAASSSYIPYVNTTESYLYNGNKYLNIYSYISSSSSNDGAYAIMPTLDLGTETINKYQVNFFARSNTGTSSNNQVIVGIVTDPSDLNTFTVVDTLTLNKQEYEPFTVSFENYQGDYLGNKGTNIMFLCEFGVSTYAYITNISVEKIPSCRPAVEFTVDSIAEDAAVISWKGYSDSYRVLVSDMILSDSLKQVYDYLQDTIVNTSDSILITNLSPATHYYVYVQSICGAADSSAISMAYANIFTDCPVIKGYPAPYYTDYDNNTATGSGKKPDCWDGVQLTYDTVGTTQSYPYVYATASYAVEKNSMYMYSYFASASNTKTYAVAPKMAGNLNDYMISFYARNGGTTTSYGHILRVGYVMDATQKGIDSTFVKIADVYVEGATQKQYQVLISDSIKEQIPAGARIALKADHSIQGLTGTSGYGTFYIDNFKIGFPPSCYPPVLEAGNSTLNTAEVIITPAKEENTNWQLAIIPDSIYNKEGFKADEYLADTIVRIIDADSTHFVVSDLQDGTKYWVYGRTVCGGEDGNSAWSDFAIDIRTQYRYKDSYFFGFEKSEGWDRSYKSTSDSYYLHPALTVGYNGGTATTSYSYYPYSIENTTAAVYAYGPADGSLGKGGMRWQSTTSYWGAYVVFPAVEEAKNRSFEFKLRSGYLTLSTMLASTTADVEVEVGTIEKYKGYETYEALATISMKALNKEISGDASNDWWWESYTFDVDSQTVADKQIVLRMPEPKVSCYAYIDNVALTEAKGYSMVAIEKVKFGYATANVSWSNIGAPWNLYVTTQNGSKVDTVASYLNITDITSKEITGLVPQTDYQIVLESANAPKDTKFNTTDTYAFTTLCAPIEPNAKGEFFWNFNDPTDWEQSDVIVGKGEVTDSAYFKPGCFFTGTTYTGTISTSNVYYNWLIQRKGYGYTGAPTTKGTTATSTARYEYGRNDSPALRVYTTSSYMTPYIVLPELNCSFDTMMVEFYGRCFANYAEDYGTASSQNKMISATYLGASYSKSIVVGTLTDPYDFSTLEVIDTLTYLQSNLPATTKVNEDPAGLRYWEKMQLPLAGAKGKYIVLFQPAYGLFFLDDLSVKNVGDNLFAPSGAVTKEVKSTTATFSWRVKHPTLQSVIVVMDQYGSEEILRDTIVGTEYTATGLNPATAYQWYMYQTNGTVNTTTTQRIEFYTECLPVGDDYSFGFELEEGWKIAPGQTNNSYKVPICWVSGNAGTNTSWSYSYEGYNQANTATYRYSHSGSYALRMQAYSTTHQPYMAMPAIADIAAYDTLQVNFWMRPAYSYAPEHSSKPNQIYTQYTLGSTASTADYYYSKSIIVGTMTDPNDPTTFVAIDTIGYDGTLAVGDMATEANDYLYQKKKVSLRGATGPYVAFMTTLYAKGDTRKATYDYMWLDDISFSTLQECSEPKNLEVTEVLSDAATLTWTGGETAEKYVLQVSTDMDFYYDTAFVFNDTVTANTITVTGLKQHTTYVWHVKSICGDDLGESDYTQNVTFVTARTPFFLEDFRETALESDWAYGTTKAELVLDSVGAEITGANNATYGFKRITNSYGLTGAHYTVPFYSSSTVSTTTYDNYWLITPPIYLEPTKQAHLTWDMALTGCATYTPNNDVVAESNMADDFTFMVAISEDGGKTWSSSNAKVWNNALPAGQQLREIPHEAANYQIDLSAFEGKNIKVAFYKEATTYLAATCALHLGNIRVAYYDKMALDTTACQYQDVEMYDFFINGDEVEAGVHEFVRIDRKGEWDATAGMLDTIYNLTVNYYEAPETIVVDTICEGETYTSVDFDGKSKPGVYRRKMQSTLYCDSIVTLHLSVTPTLRAEDQIIALCPGETYTWNSKEYNRAGIYRDTTISSLGCDSIQTLVLSFNEAEDTIYAASEVDITELPFTYENVQYPYAAGQAPIFYPTGTAKGVYNDTVLVQGVNCVAVLVHTLTVTDRHEGIEDVMNELGAGARKVLYQDNLYIICNDDWYTATGQKVNDPRK